ncbi:MAG: hypothetical protein ACYCSO_05375 [Cuniculiplasma sp.]
MKLTSVLGGAALLSFYFGMNIYEHFILFFVIDLIPVLALGSFLFVSGIRSKSVNTIRKKSEQSIFDGIMKMGLEKIRRGDLMVDEAKFSIIMNKLNKFIVDQREVPEFGFNSLYLRAATESEAEDFREKIKNMGIDCKVMQDRGKYYIMIEF